MKDNSIRHISELDACQSLEIISHEEGITLSIETFMMAEPSKTIIFTKEGIKELIHDLNQLIK